MQRCYYATWLRKTRVLDWWPLFLTPVKILTKENRYISHEKSIVFELYWMDFHVSLKMHFILFILEVKIAVDEVIICVFRVVIWSLWLRPGVSTFYAHTQGSWRPYRPGERWQPNDIHDVTNFINNLGFSLLPTYPPT